MALCSSGTVQQRGRRQLEAARQARHGGLAARRGVGARGDGDLFRRERLRILRIRRGAAGRSPSNMRSMPVLPLVRAVAAAGAGASGGLPAGAVSSCGAM